MVPDRSDVAQALADAPDVAAACEAVADLLVAKGFDLPSVYLLRGGRLRCYAARGYWQVIDGFPPGVGVIGRVLLSGRSVFLPDAYELDEFIAAIPGLRGEASVPIILDDSPVGVMNIESLDVLQPAALDHLEACAAALTDRIRELGGLPDRSLYEVLADRVVDFSTLSSAAQVHTHLCEAALELSDMSTVLIVRCDDRDALSVAARSGPLAEQLAQLGPDDLAEVAGWVEHGTSCYFAGGTASTAHAFFERAGAGSALILPLTAHGARGGVLIIADEGVVACSPDRVQLLEQLAAHGAASLQSVETVDNLRELALTDTLTGVGNSAAFDGYTDNLADTTGAYAVCILDIDHFKRINDTRGHIAGDDMLREVAAALADAGAPAGRVFRIGGDEFVVVVPSPDESSARAFGAALCDAARRSGRYTISVGITFTERPDRNAIAAADRALYAVKRRGRDGHAFAHMSDPAITSDQPSRDDPWSVPTTLAEEINEVVFTVDGAGRWTYLNHAWEKLVGERRDESLGRALLDWVAADHVDGCVAGFHALCAGAVEAFRTEVLWSTDHGTRWFELWARPLRTPVGDTIGAVGTLSDVTARRTAEDALRRQLEFSTVITHVLERFASVGHDDLDAAIDDALEQVGGFAGVDRSYLFSFSTDLITADNTHEWCAEGIEPQIHRLQNMPLSLIAGWLPQLRDGRAVHVPRIGDLPDDMEALRAELGAESIQSLVVVPLSTGTRLLGFLGFDSVTTERTWSDQEIALLRSVANALVSLLSRHDATGQLTRQALLDPLTGLANRTTFNACLRQALAERQRHAGAVAVVIAQLHGCAALDDDSRTVSDEVRRAVAARISATLRSPDVLARIGVDHFALVCTDLDNPETAQQIGRRVADAVRRPTVVGTTTLQVTAAIGIAVADARSNADADALMADAERALRQTTLGRDDVALRGDRREPDTVQSLIAG